MRKKFLLILFAFVLLFSLVHITSASTKCPERHLFDITATYAYPDDGEFHSSVEQESTDNGNYFALHEVTSVTANFCGKRRNNRDTGGVYRHRIILYRYATEVARKESDTKYGTHKTCSDITFNFDSINADRIRAEMQCLGQHCAYQSSKLKSYTGYAFNSQAIGYDLAGNNPRIKFESARLPESIKPGSLKIYADDNQIRTIPTTGNDPCFSKSTENGFEVCNVYRSGYTGKIIRGDVCIDENKNHICDSDEFTICCPTEKKCDGIDNDCDGKIDEDDEMSQKRNHGVCKGFTNFCVKNKDTGLTYEDFSKVSTYENVVGKETKCDGLDNNCNGDIDEGCTAQEYVYVRQIGTQSRDNYASITFNSNGNLHIMYRDGSYTKYQEIDNSAKTVNSGSPLPEFGDRNRAIDKYGNTYEMTKEHSAKIIKKTKNGGIITEFQIKKPGYRYPDINGHVSSITVDANQAIYVYDGTDNTYGQVYKYAIKECDQYATCNPANNKQMCSVYKTWMDAPAETCGNKKDDNCDGQIDEDCTSDGLACTQNYECKTGFCNSQNKCGKIALGLKCSNDNECLAGFCNSQSTCGKQRDGLACSSEADCSSNICNSVNKCGKLYDGNACTANFDCKSNFCNSQKTCGKLYSNYPCVNNQDCQSNICGSQNKCTSGYDGNTCGVDSDCQSNICNSQRKCGKLIDGNSCSKDLECKSDNCIDNQCITLKVEGLACSNDNQCQSGKCAFSNNHKKDVCTGTLAAGAVCNYYYNNLCKSGVCKFDYEDKRSECFDAEEQGSDCSNSNDCQFSCIYDFDQKKNVCSSNHLNGNSCTKSYECYSGACRNNVCVALIKDGYLCTGDDKCGSGKCYYSYNDRNYQYKYRCSFLEPPGNQVPWTQAYRCASGTTTLNSKTRLYVCKGDTQLGQSCTEGYECDSGQCVNGKCNRNYNDGYQCDNSYDCQSEKCVKPTSAKGKCSTYDYYCGDNYCDPKLESGTINKGKANCPIDCCKQGTSAAQSNPDCCVTAGGCFDTTASICRYGQVSSEITCNDNIDNDCDGKVDNRDTDCCNPATSTAIELEDGRVNCVSNTQITSLLGGKNTWECVESKNSRYGTKYLDWCETQLQNPDTSYKKRCTNHGDIAHCVEKDSGIYSNDDLCIKGKSYQLKYNLGGKETDQNKCSDKIDNDCDDKIDELDDECCTEKSPDNKVWSCRTYSGDYGVSWNCNYIDRSCGTKDTCIDTKGNHHPINKIATNLNPGGKDDIAYCFTNSYWQNCDKYAKQCGTTCPDEIVKSGELSAHGEFTGINTIGCCGDDSNEFYVTGKDGTKACCNKANDFVVNSKCFDSTVNLDTESGCGQVDYKWIENKCCKLQSPNYIKQYDNDKYRGHNLVINGCCTGSICVTEDQQCINPGVLKDFDNDGETEICQVDGSWEDLDDLSTECDRTANMKYFKPGQNPTGVGTHDFKKHIKEGFCCGDDPGEHTAKSCNSNAIVGCCSDTNQFISDGKCVSTCCTKGSQSQSCCNNLGGVWLDGHCGGAVGGDPPGTIITVQGNQYILVTKNELWDQTMWVSTTDPKERITANSQAVQTLKLLEENKAELSPEVKEAFEKRASSTRFTKFAQVYRTEIENLFKKKAERETDPKKKERFERQVVKIESTKKPTDAELEKTRKYLQENREKAPTIKNVLGKKD